MGIKTIPLSHPEADVRKTLNDCADSGSTVIVQLPDQRLLAIQPLDPDNGDDDLVNQLLDADPAFRALVEKSKKGATEAVPTRAARAIAGSAESELIGCNTTCRVARRRSEKRRARGNSIHPVRCWPNRR